MRYTSTIVAGLACGLLVSTLHASTRVQPRRPAVIVYNIATDGSAVVSNQSRGELIANDVAYILTGIARAPGGNEAIRQIMGVRAP